MFCKVTLMGDGRSQNTQLMRAVKAIATATAGSTPSVTGSTAYNNANTGQYEVITTVLDNTIAGGWTVKADQTSLTATGVSANAYFESLMLYRDTGKSGLPYLWFSMIEGSYINTFTTNPGPFLSFGYATTLANCNYGSGFNTYAKVAPNSVQPAATDYVGSCPFAATGGDFLRVAGISNASTRVYYISATSEFIHIQQDVATTNSIHCGSWFHLGLRTNSSWEDNYNDNPYWVALWCAQGSASAYTGQANDAAGYWTVMRTIDTTTGIVGSPVNIWRATATSSSLGTYTYQSPLTNVAQNATYSTPYYVIISPHNPTNVTNNVPTNYSTSGSSSAGTTYTTTVFSGTAAALQSNIFNVFWGTSTATPSVGVTSDSTTGALISPALPLYIRYTGTNNFGGYMKNLFQGGIYSSAAELDLYHVPDAVYTIDGSNYIGLRMGYVASNSGPNPRQLLYVKSS